MTRKFEVYGRKMTDSERTKRWKDKNPQKVRDMRYKRMYGVSSEFVDQMIKDQDYSCAICRETLDMGKHTHIDHCHSTNKVRGVLCNLCNTGLGKFKDDPKLLNHAINYLELTF